MNQKKYDLSTRIEAVGLYSKGYLAKEVAEMLNATPAIVTYWVRAAGITRHRGPKSKIGAEDFFDCIDNEIKAYFLGWIMADGNISITNGQYCLKLHIGIDDKILIDGFLKHINSTNKTKEKIPGKKGHGSYYVSLTSVHMCKNLIKLGVVPNKTGSETFSVIPAHLEPHFVRGYFDGDGVTCTKKNKRSGFIGPQEMLDSIQEKLGTSLTTFQHKAPVTPTFYFLGSKTFSRTLYKYMYSDANIWLPRKRKQLEIVCNFDNTEITNRDNTLLAS